jgi:hypothetical protein
MGKRYNEIQPDHREFIANQKIFFIGSAAATGRVNVSPKGMDTLRVVDSQRVIWLNLTGSGNETAAHLLKNDRMTIMFCAFEGKPKILRLYGKARVYHPRDSGFNKYIRLFPEIPGSRQIIDMDVDLVQTSCGFAVPLMDFREERSILSSWADKQGDAKIKTYWEERNSMSIDGFETGILGDG